MGRKKLGKRGSWDDLLWIAVFIFFFCLVSLFGYKVYGEFDDKIQSMDQFDNLSKNVSTQGRGVYGGVLDSSALLLVGILAIGAFIMASLVRVHPAFAMLFILLLVVLIFLCGIFSNVYEEIASHPEMSSYANDLVFMSNIMTYLPFIVGIFGSILAIIMYKSGQDGGLG